MRLIVVFCLMVMVNAVTAAPNLIDALIDPHPEQARQWVGFGFGVSFAIGLAGVPMLKEVMEGRGWLMGALGINVILVVCAMFAGVVGRFVFYAMTSTW